eukprot:scaffold30241_cov28-Tisochrysis_lutea.AAC.7
MFFESIPHSFRTQISLTFLRHTNAAAYTLLAVITLLPGGVLAMELDELWDVDDVGVRAAISEVSGQFAPGARSTNR